MMEQWRAGQLPDPPAPKKNRRKTSDRIYTFDIEVTSMFKHAYGWGPFDYDRPPEYYRDLEKAAVPYIWMLGIEQDDGSGRAVFGRYFNQLPDLFRELGNPETRKIIWVHNLNYEMTFLFDVLHVITEVVARSCRHPIKFYCPEYNLEFRCSFCLTNMSLKEAAKAYGKTRKESGEKFNYNVMRSPLTHLTRQEMKYCEKDVLALIEIIQYYRELYKHLRHIPLTQTGRIRKELRERVKGTNYIKQVRKLVPQNYYVMCLLMRAFWGGYVHACYMTANQIWQGLSDDKASAYPADMCSYRYPMSRFFRITPERAAEMDPEKWAIMYHARLYGVRCRLINTYIPAAKMVSVKNAKMDNGRIITADEIEITCTEVDWEIIRRVYDIERIEYIDLWASRKRWLPVQLLDYVLTLYERKTKLKNVAGQEVVYANSKISINGLFGCCVTNVIKQSTELTETEDGYEWTTHALTPEFIDEKLEALRKSKTNCFSYAWGVWITAYCRRTTWALVEELDPVKVGLDKAAWYSDTDSVKAPDSQEARDVMQHLNQERERRLREMCEENGLDFERTRPKDPDGVPHPFGAFEVDGEYQEFKTLGCKRYAYRDKKGLHLTVSGVRKSTGVKALRGNINNFTRDMVYSYKECGKSISLYIDDQQPFDFTDREGNCYHSTQHHSICLYPTTYNLSISDFYAALWERAITKGRVRQ